jgi:hypothetical protein
MNLSTFKLLVADTAKRGATLDSFIPVAIKQAVSWLERNFSYPYMKKYSTFVIDPDSAEPRALSLPNDRLKQVLLLRLVGSDGRYYNLTRVEPQEIAELLEGQPCAFWLDGVDLLWFDRTPTEEQNGEIRYVERTNWDVLEDSDTHWLLQHANDLLLYQTMLQISPYNRDPTLMTLYRPLRDEALRTTILDAEEFEQGPARSLVMKYGQG